ncbi:MAG TPA: glycolate oxidase subunit GlcF [Usitatibacteraceae bacterium]|nr:glycolate oxidase subunit GlcF [Usitatibacteraceae bacterium]
MQTNLADWIKDTPEGLEADAILRKCVHCGFCLATCPTYNLLGDELDSPRGRIYLMKQALEGAPVTARTRVHLDRCLTCRACETTCPSGVQYGRLVDIGREVVERKVPRGFVEGLVRRVLRFAFLSGPLFAFGVGAGRLIRPLLPASLASQVPPKRGQGAWPAARHARRMIVLGGCVQPTLAPDINAATARVLDRLSISLVSVPQAGCCGAIEHHLNAQAAALDRIRRQIDAWWPHVEAGAEAIVITASGCGTMVQDYGHLLAGDRAYAAKAARITGLAKDVGQVIAAEREPLSKLLAGMAPVSEVVAYHAPCSLQHGLRQKGIVEGVLRDAGFQLAAVPDAHVCCGSAGTYSILQPALSGQLLANKVAALESGAPAAICTSNIGCLLHIESGTRTPVSHWIELLDQRLSRGA